MLKSLFSGWGKGKGPTLRMSWDEAALRFSANPPPLSTWDNHLLHLASGPQKRLAQALREWLEQDLAAESPTELSIGWDALQLALVEEEQSDWLAEAFPGSLALESSSHFSDPNLRFVLTPKPRPGVSTAGWRRQGAFAIQGGKPYLLQANQHALWKAVDAFNQRPTEEKNFEQHLAFWAGVKSHGLHEGVILSQHLQDETALRPQRVGVEVEAHPDGSLELHPQLESVEDFTLDQMGPADRPVPTVITLKKRNEVHRQRVVLGTQQREALRQIRANRRIPKEQAQAFVNHPEIFLDPNVVDLSGFSDRVIGIGQAPASMHPLIQREPRKWKPTEVALLIAKLVDGEAVEVEVKLHSPEDLQPFVKAHNKALAAGQSTFTLGGHLLPAGEQTQRDFDLLNQALEAIEDGPGSEDTKEATPTTEEQQSAHEPEAKKRPEVLLVSENLDELQYQAIEDQASGPDSLPILEKPVGLRPHIRLLPHQEEGIARLQSAWRAKVPGMLLADDMGLGKTLQILTFWRWCRSQNPDMGPMLVVAPVALLENWTDELEKFLEDCPGGCIQLHGSRIQDHRLPGTVGHELAQGHAVKKLRVAELQGTGIILTNYETVRNYQFSLASLNLGLLVLDEAQKAKNPMAQQTRAIKALNARFQLVATGTPVENDLADLWCLMDIAQPGQLGSLSHFRKKFTPEGSADLAPTQLEELKEQVHGAMIRRMKVDILKDLPEKRVLTERVAMTTTQQQRYLEVLAETKKSRHDRMAMIAALQWLRLVSVHPALLQPDGWTQIQAAKLSAESPKLEATLALVKRWQAQQVKGVLFAREKPVQRVLQKLIRESLGFEAAIVNGETPGAANTQGVSRKRIIDAFQAEQGFGTIILSPEAVGYGLTITAANHVVHVTRLWNPAKEDQATDRVHRIGQTKEVSVHNLLSTCVGLASFDEVLHELQEDKRKLAQNILCPTSSLDLETAVADKLWA